MLTVQKPTSAKAEAIEDETVTSPETAEPDTFEAEQPRRRKGPIVLVGLLVLLALLGAGFYYYWSEYLGAGDRWLSIKNLEGQEIVAKEGKVFFISGSVLNGSTKARKFLILRSKLYDREGTVLAEKDVVAGLTLSKESVATMQKLDIEKKINDFKLSSEDNFQVGKGKQIPFTILFFDEGFDKAKEFTVEIIESPVL
jgi:hypothetical protein